jgi:DNA-binding NarL/FixJ family response regulator
MRETKISTKPCRLERWVISSKACPIRRVYEGNRFLPPPVSQALSSRSSGSELSQREREVLGLMVAGNSNREIGEKLHIKEPTVKSHITLILMRLGVTDRTQAVVEALKRGLEHL